MKTKKVKFVQIQVIDGFMWGTIYALDENGRIWIGKCLHVGEYIWQKLEGPKEEV